MFLSSGCGHIAEHHEGHDISQERFRSLGPIYYRGADAAVLVYDVTSEASFARVRSWIKELKQMVGLSYPLYRMQLQCEPSGAASKRHSGCQQRMYVRQVDGNIALAIAGNKQDADPADWRVTHAEATSLATATGATHFRTSARTGDGVDALFRDAAQRGLAARSGRSELPGAVLAICIALRSHVTLALVE